MAFEKYGGQYFLHEVICHNVASLNLEVAPSKAALLSRKAPHGGFADTSD